MKELYELLEKDYGLAVGTFENMQLLYNYRFKNNNYTETQKANFLMNLGVIGEKLLKYIFGIYLLELNNKQIMSKTPEEFDELFRASNKRIKEIANILKLDLNSLEFQKLLNYKDENNQKAHNIEYYYYLINTLNHSYLENLFKKYFEWKSFSDKPLYGGVDYGDGFVIPPIIALFPSELNGLYNVRDIEFEEAKEKSQTHLKILKNYSLKKGGDSFTRFRYAINNADGRNINIDAFYESIIQILNITIMIHNNKSLSFDLDYEFFKYSFLHNSSIIGFNEEQAKYILNLDLGYSTYFNMFGLNYYSYEEIKEIVDYGFDEREMKLIFNFGLKLKTILSYYEKKIYDLNIIHKKEEELTSLKEAEEEIIVNKLYKEFEMDEWFEQQEKRRQNFY